MPASSDDIFTAAQKQMTALQAADLALDAKANAIKAANPGVPLTAAQIKEVIALNQQQIPLLNAIAELAYVTAAALDSASGIATLTTQLGGVVTTLNASAASITAAGADATAISNASTSVTNLITQIKTLVPAKP